MIIQKPLISVIMPVYNSGAYLEKAIKSVLSQTYKDFEFIIINDGSHDITSRILSKLSDERIKVINLEKNQGIVNALNIGVRQSRGQYLARMDADDISHPNRFEKQLVFLKNNPLLAAVGSFTRVINKSGKQLFTTEPPTRDSAIHQHLLKDSCIAHGSVMMRKDLVQKIGGYNNSPKVKHAEDYDLFVRLAKHYQLANIPEYLYTRIEHESSVSHQNYLQQSHAARYIADLARKNLPKQKSPSISVLMPTYNNANYIGAAIQSVMDQTFKDWELVIIDDASTDNTKKVISKYLSDPRVYYLVNPDHLGKARSRNRLLKESTGNILVELDADDAISPKSLKMVYEAHAKTPDAGLIYSQFYYCDANLKPIKEGFCRASYPGETNLHNHHATALRTYKRKYIEQTAGYDVTLDGAEDLDMIYKIEEVAPIKFIDYPLYYYRNYPRPNNASITRQSIMSRMKANYYAYRRRLYNKKIPNISFKSIVIKTTHDIYSIVLNYLRDTLSN